MVRQEASFQLKITSLGRRLPAYRRKFPLERSLHSISINQSIYSSRLRLQLGGSITVEKARALQETRKQLGKEARAAGAAAAKAKKRLYQAGVKARKLERLRKKRVAALQK
jgi:hypothetical protein